MEATIGINQRIPIEAIELALKAVLNATTTTMLLSWPVWSIVERTE